MGLKDDLRQLNTDFNSGLDALSADIKRLEDKIANTPAAEDVSGEVASLRSTVDRLRGMDLPDPEAVPADGGTASVPTGTGTVVDPGTLDAGGDVATDSPGENQPVEQEPAPGTVEDPAPQETEPVNPETGEPAANSPEPQEDSASPEPQPESGENV